MMLLRMGESWSEWIFVGAGIGLLFLFMLVDMYCT